MSLKKFLRTRIFYRTTLDESFRRAFVSAFGVTNSVIRKPSKKQTSTINISKSYNKKSTSQNRF